MKGYDYYLQAKAYAQSGDLQKTVECLKMADKGDEGDPFAAPILARIYIQTALQSAAVFLKQFIKDVEEMDIPGINADSEMYELGCILTLLGKDEEAWEYYFDRDFSLQGLSESINKWKEDF